MPLGGDHDATSKDVSSVLPTLPSSINLSIINNDPSSQPGLSSQPAGQPTAQLFGHSPGFSINRDNQSAEESEPDSTTSVTSEHELHAQCTSFQKIITSLISGAIAGTVAKSTIAPLDRTKIHFQISDKSYSFKRAVRFLYKSAQQDGISSLWRGNSATVVRIVPYAGIQFASHEKWKDVIGAQTQTSTPLRRYMAGCLAGVTAVTFTYPLDLARARMAVSNKCQYKSIYSVFRNMVVEEGAFSLFRGFMPTLIGIIPYAGTSFFVYETLKKNHYENPNREGEPSHGQRVVYGACAGLLGQAATYPLDIIRRRMQTAPMKDKTVEYKSMAATLKSVVTNEGWRAVYKGLSMNFIKGPVATGISFCTNDMIKNNMRRWLIQCDD